MSMKRVPLIDPDDSYGTAVLRRRVEIDAHAVISRGDPAELDREIARLRKLMRRSRFAGYRVRLKLAYLDLLHFLGREG